jgi:hypothetical protein
MTVMDAGTLSFFGDIDRAVERLGDMLHGCGERFLVWSASWLAKP